MNFRSTVNSRRYSSSVMEADQSRTDLASLRIGSLVLSPRRLGWQWPGDTSSCCSTMLLFNVTVERSLGPLKVIMSPEKTVRDLIKLSVQMYRNENRRPLLKEVDPRRFELHYSPFSLERLRTDEKLINLGSRNFFLCAKPSSFSKSSHRSNHDGYYPFPFPMANLMDLLL